MRIHLEIKRKLLYFDYPLEQGLRPLRHSQRQSVNSVYFDYPLEQGLRLSHALLKMFPSVYFDYPLEQGLRREKPNRQFPPTSILIIH